MKPKGQPDPPDDYSDLVPWYDRLADFQREALMGLGRYRPLPIELETAPRANRAECASNEAVIVTVQPKARGRTSPRPVFVYTSLNQAMRIHGRWVRTSIESGSPTPQGSAKRTKGAWYSPSDIPPGDRAR